MRSKWFFSKILKIFFAENFFSKISKFFFSKTRLITLMVFQAPFGRRRFDMMFLYGRYSMRSR